ncbi:MAG TPA: L-histidine N(alpha)-methyltransferase [Candidatus Acidoferrales bacterium]|nr:L-histidine N(alpha)-methyltransferase [Candidatus Acidoferrales bacterium]
MAATFPVLQREFSPESEFAVDVRAGLSQQAQKEIPSKYLYDGLGSALFEAICFLPEYGLHRAGARLMCRHSSEIARRMRSATMVAELGSGTGDNVRKLLESLASADPIDYFPIDISAHALTRCRQELGAIEGVRFNPVQSAYLEGLEEVSRLRGDAGKLIVLFLGSTIGNIDRHEAARFCSQIRRHLRYGDGFVLAADLEKPISQLISAYDDSVGVTAAFNLNVLARINRELGANFDLQQFAHEARWNSADRRIEMHLTSQRDQVVMIPAANIKVSFRAGETIRTESCHKFNRPEVVEMAHRAGFRCEALWIDPEWPFAQFLFSAA